MVFRIRNQAETDVTYALLEAAASYAAGSSVVCRFADCRMDAAL